MPATLTTWVGNVNLSPVCEAVSRIPGDGPLKEEAGTSPPSRAGEKAESWEKAGQLSLLLVRFPRQPRALPTDHLLADEKPPKAAPDACAGSDPGSGCLDGTCHTVGDGRQGHSGAFEFGVLENAPSVCGGLRWKLTHTQ